MSALRARATTSNMFKVSPVIVKPNIPEMLGGHFEKD
jgi:hypothetical protein